MEKREAKASQNPVMYRERIRWQGWTERKKKGLALLLANEKAMGPFLDFYLFIKINRSGWKRRSEGPGAGMAAKGMTGMREEQLTD